MMYHIESLRLEPIINIESHKKFGYEVLSNLSRNIKAELWYSTLQSKTQISILHYQMNTVYKNRIPEPCFFNITINALLRLSFCDIKKIRWYESYGIEISDFDKIDRLSDDDLNHLLRKVFIMNEVGIRVMIDDLKMSEIKYLELFKNFIYGIKIDHSELTSNNLRYIVMETNKNSDIVIIEGVERKDYLKIAKTLKLKYAQGYLWSDENLILSVDPL
ncbi:EAL domain [Salmonella enterica subsp. enterica serovar Braenderup]|nr:EAL domain [Salmonella enterica subsp. enterica serovar Braenderup]